MAGCEPDEMGIGPVFAIPRLLENAGLKQDDIDIWDSLRHLLLNVYTAVTLGLDNDKYNVLGGSISRSSLWNDWITSNRSGPEGLENQ